MLRFSSPVTAAGPSPILTEFPFALNIEHLIIILLVQDSLLLVKLIVFIFVYFGK
jgi:hypothetical protein